jgi:phosphopantothenoylcysteine decarboxylase/phosphopantothenate--cysteine ligase
MTAPLHHRRCWSPAQRSCQSSPTRRLLITAGPTHEPIDSVRFIGNRSSGRMGIALAEAAAQLGWEVTLLLGPVSAAVPTHDRIQIERFRTCDDLQHLLGTHADRADILIMAAAVADYRPKPNPAMSGGKFRRTGGPITLELESTPDLLAGVSATGRADQLFVGFALEPRADLLASAQSKLRRKKIDLVVANPLETMDSSAVEALILASDGSVEHTDGVLSKAAFAHWLLARIDRRAGARAMSARSANARMATAA